MSADPIDYSRPDERAANLDAQVASAKAEAMVRVMGLEEQLRLEIQQRDAARVEVAGLRRTVLSDFDEIEKLQGIIVELADALVHAMPCVQGFYSDRGERGDSEDVYALQQFDHAFKLAAKYQTPLSSCKTEVNDDE